MREERLRSLRARFPWELTNRAPSLPLSWEARRERRVGCMGSRLRVRAIEYAVVSRDMADLVGLSPAVVKVKFGELSDLAVLKCVDLRGRKLTAVGDPDDLRDMLANTGARRSDDLDLTESRWPVLMRGWYQTV